MSDEAPPLTMLLDGQPVVMSPEALASLPAALPAPPGEVAKLVVVDRLAALGLLRPALAALEIDTPAAQLTDAALALRERWLAARVIARDDAAARALIVAIGGDPDAILA